MSAFVYKLTNGAIVHPHCREEYQRLRSKAQIGIDSAIHADEQTGELPPSKMFKDGRFQLCDHCAKPIMDYLAQKEAA